MTDPEKPGPGVYEAQRIHEKLESGGYDIGGRKVFCEHGIAVECDGCEVVRMKERIAELEVEVQKWKDRHDGMAQNHLDEMGKVAELEARLEEAGRLLCDRQWSVRILDFGYCKDCEDVEESCLECSAHWHDGHKKDCLLSLFLSHLDPREAA